jgi:hypothetical protein
MDTFTEAEKLIKKSEVKPEDAPVVPVAPDFNEIMRHMDNAVEAVKVQHEKNMSEAERYNAEVKKALDIQIGKVEVTLAQLENFCTNNLPKIIKQNIEGNYYSRVKEITSDIEKDTKDFLLKIFGEFGNALSEYENQAQRAAALVSNKSKQPLHISLLHGAKWLAISLAFTFLFLKVNTYLDNRESDYGRKARAFISSLPAADAKRINKIINEMK